MEEIPVANKHILVKSVELFTLAFLATVFYILLGLPVVENWFICNIPDYEYRFITKAILFFVVIYLLDRLVMFIKRDLRSFK